MAKVDDLYTFVADLDAEALDLAVRHGEEPVDHPQLAHQLQRRGMHGATAEVAQEVRMLLEHRDAHTRAREQKCQHHSRGTRHADAALPGD